MTWYVLLLQFLGWGFKTAFDYFSLPHPVPTGNLTVFLVCDQTPSPSLTGLIIYRCMDRSLNKYLFRLEITSKVQLFCPFEELEFS